ncbi:tRNA 2-selenouridine(34) synthase MnmH [Anianabacter salinae]|uniref:tRNA 2-selenouridine(34) synthase MnmH n=1 Tax=Anianabacter salinae TaxID=2851023 RepID=UPI00225E37ED|nr:tRNA 2-selenouridine(34) synthase MnmH [Anianabacter salinae]MBV0912391.1 tRNA 2-selenouridine(34) synthase MnmH [Anianabacter salinae]
MQRQIQTLAEFRKPDADTVIDVRSPSEYAEDHVPGAISLPVFSDAERAEVGTIYVQDSPFVARKIGAAILARNTAHHLETALADKDGGWRPLVYCWRGGQRSGGFATILAAVGWRSATVAGGYKAYRRLVVDALHRRDLPHRLILLDGNTGTAKTDLLHRLAARGAQVVDLEGAGNHRGSVLGHRAGGQPSQKWFEGTLAHAFDVLDPARPVVVEAESAKVGNLLVPPAIWGAMKDAPRLWVAAPLDARARYLTRAYADVIEDRAALTDTLAQLIPHQGREVVEGWQAMVADGRFEPLAADLMARHYDPRYAAWRSGKSLKLLGEAEARTLDEDDLDRVAGDLLRCLAPHDPALA